MKPRPLAFFRRVPRAAVLIAVPCLRAADTADGWALAAEFRFEAARAAFAGQAPTAESRLGAVIGLLGGQVLKPGDLGEAEKTLRRIEQEEAGKESAIVARYLLARIEHVHRPDGLPAEAARRYRALFEAHPGHPLAGHALVKYALVTLYQTNALTPEAALAHLEPLAARLPTPEARRDFHLALANACLFFALPEETALGHFLRAAEADAAEGLQHGDTLLTIAELARRAGRLEVARTYYARFVKASPGDRRQAIAQGWLRELEAVSVAGPALAR